MEISHQISWSRSGDSFCDDTTITSGTLIGPGGNLECQVGCFGTVGSMQYYCTDYSETEDWSTGSRSYSYTFTSGVTQFEAL